MPPTTTTTTVAPPPVTVPRTLPLVSVMTQGAKGDGVNNDTAAFQAALDNAGLATVGRIDVPPGTYVVGPLTVPAGVLLVGAGPGSVLRRATGTTGALLSTSGTHVTLQSLHLDGGGIQVLAAASRVRIVDCEVTGAPDPAITSAGTGVIIAGNVRLRRRHRCHRRERAADLRHGEPRQRLGVCRHPGHRQRQRQQRHHGHRQRHRHPCGPRAGRHRRRRRDRGHGVRQPRRRQHQRRRWASASASHPTAHR